MLSDGFFDDLRRRKDYYVAKAQNSMREVDNLTKAMKQQGCFEESVTCQAIRDNFNGMVFELMDKMRESESVVAAQRLSDSIEAISVLVGMIFSVVKERSPK